MSRLLLPDGEPPITRLRAALDARPKARTVRQEPIIGEFPKSEAARRFWSERAWSEFAAIPGMAQMSLALIRDGASLDALDAIAAIGRDEVRHTAVSRDLAERMGGYIDEIPEDSAYEPATLADPYWAPFAGWVVSIGCISETVSLELMRTRLNYTKHPVVREVLGNIAKDEAMHARLSWLMAEELFPRLTQCQRDNLASYAEEELSVLRRSFVTLDLPSFERDRVRRMRNDVASLGMGAAPTDEEDAVFDRTKNEIIVPRLRALGVELASAP